MISLPHMVMISGSGKNVGKTTLSTILIKNLVQDGHSVYSIKTSSHLHPLDEDEHFLLHDEDLDIIEERRTNSKDSSKMLQAGAKKSFYIQADRSRMEYALSHVLELIPTDAAILCESGGAREFLKPGLFLYLTGNGQNKNAVFRQLADITLQFNGKGWNNFHPEYIQFNGTEFILKESKP